MSHTNYVYSNKQTTLPLKTITTTRHYLSTQNMDNSTYVDNQKSPISEYFLCITKYIHVITTFRYLSLQHLIAAWNMTNKTVQLYTCSLNM